MLGSLFCIILISLSCCTADLKGKSLPEFVEKDGLKKIDAWEMISESANQTEMEKYAVDIFKDFCRILVPDCEETGGSCFTDTFGMTRCRCPSGTIFDKFKGCRMVEDECVQLKPNCSETRGICVRGKNMTTKCSCPKYKVYIKGLGCQVQRAACDFFQPNCEETGGSCSFHPNGDIELFQCMCPQGALYNENTGCPTLCNKKKSCDDPRKTCNSAGFCVCPEGYEGHDCTEISGCKMLEEKCNQIGTRCVFAKAVPGMATCKCEDGYRYDNWANECKPLCNKNKSCDDPRKTCNSAGFCVCPEGYEGHDCTEIKGCKILEEKCNQIRTECVFDQAVPGMAACKCEDGFIYDKWANECKHLCIPNPCKNGGTCRMIQTEVLCSCVKPYGGKYCNFRTDWKKNIVIFSVVVALLGLVVISGTCCFWKGVCSVKKSDYNHGFNNFKTGTQPSPPKTSVQIP